ncbi:MAG: hypothetical protein HY671_05165 [Chloroflexi bacterium]|nr:hypothetical protein [Chloroflexota bacterium]
MAHMHMEKTEDLGGFALQHGRQGDTIDVLVKASMTCDEPEFYHYVDQISNMFLGKHGIPTNAVFQFLVLVHKDLGADLYLNDFQVEVEIRIKGEVKKGELVRQDNIADIHRLRFPEIKIAETDKVIYCFKVGWKFGLYFDLARPENLDIGKMGLAIGRLYRHLSFQYVYSTLQTEALFDEMLNDGWFPFVEIMAREYKDLSDAYQQKFDLENRVQKVIDRFDKARVESMTARWWRKDIFNEKRPLIEAGVNAYLDGGSGGCINCIKNLLTEVEGILRNVYLKDTAKGSKVKTRDLLQHLTEKGAQKAKSDDSLLLPTPFLKYLTEVMFRDFDVEAGKLDLSRHSASHGVARPEDYTRARALQVILVLDQISFYI